MANHYFARAATAALLTLAGMSVGCDKRPPTQPAPATPVTVAAISPAAGLPGDLLNITGSGFLPGAWVTLGGRSARPISITDSLIRLRAPFHDAGPVDVIVANGGGPSTTLSGGFTYEAVSLTSSSNNVVAGSQLSVSWTAPAGRPSEDRVALFRVEDDDDHYGWHEHTGGLSSGTLSLTAPTQVGQYEFRYLARDVAVARSSPVTIAAAGN